MSNNNNAKVTAEKARDASLRFMNESTQFRNNLLVSIADALLAKRDTILQANQKDLEEAKRVGCEPNLFDRLKLNESKLETLANGIKQLTSMQDPIGNVLQRTKVSEGLILERRSVPIGVLLVIFESRPDVLPQVASLALKSGNALLLKGGKEALHSNRELFSILSECLGDYKDLIALVETRQEIAELLTLKGYIDLIIPRGSGQLVEYIQENTKIPVLGHAEGICHVYVDEEADLEKAKKIVIDSKTNYPSACNSAETLLIHKNFPHATELLSALVSANVTLYGGPIAAPMFNLSPFKSFKTEYGTSELTVEIVDDLQSAIKHINHYGSGHTDSIVCENAETCDKFLNLVDSACVFKNASTRFADGFRFGLGCEVGISTGRIHSRGPVGIDGLLTTKWQLKSDDSHTVTEFSNGTRTYVHEKLQ